MPKLSHEILMAGAFADDTANDTVRFFDRERFKAKGEFVGPPGFTVEAVNPLFVNLLTFSPLLYQTTQRAKMDAQDIGEKIHQAMIDEHISAIFGLAILGQLEDLKTAIEVAQKAARDGLEL